MVGKMMMIVNPASANGKTGSNWAQMDSHLRSLGLEFSEQMTAAAGDATRMTRQALCEGYTTIVSVGGDGTLNETLNGFFEQGSLINPEARLGVICCGTGGDFVRTSGIPREFPEAARLLKEGKSRTLDVGQIVFNTHEGERVSRYYLNVAGFGLDGEVVYRVNNTSKALGGFLSFLWGTVYGILAHQSLPIKLEVDDQICYEGMMTIVAVANGQYFGGGMQIAPMAQLESGHFEVVLIEAMSKFELLTCLPTIYKGTHINNPHFKAFSGSRVKATSPQQVLVDIDGEQPGQLDAEFSIIPACLPVIC